jgi:hypothetical protein
VEEASRMPRKILLPMLSKTSKVLSAYVSIRHHTSAYVRRRQHTDTPPHALEDEQGPVSIRHRSTNSG